MGDNATDNISSSLKHIQTTSFSDFVALALPNRDGSRYRWHYAHGNQNQRYKQMLVKRGKGLPGMALLCGICLTKDARLTEPGDLTIDCPLMWAEALEAAAAIPLPTTSGDNGILMVGKRYSYCYSPAELVYLEECARYLTPLCETTKHRIIG
jgi:nitrogen regulatory protein A